MSGNLPPGATQNEIDRLIEDEAPDMEWDSATGRWIPLYPGVTDAGDDLPEAETAAAVERLQPKTVLGSQQPTLEPADDEEKSGTPDWI